MTKPFHKGSTLKGKNLLIEEQSFSFNPKAKIVYNFGLSECNRVMSGPYLKKRVKVSHSLIAIGAVGVRVPLFLGHSK